MKKKLLFFYIVFFTLFLNAQQQDAWVFLTDKENVAASISNPISILTQEAIDRKTLHNTPIDERDVPVNETYITQLKTTAGITVMAKSKWMNAVHVRGTQSDINNLSGLTFVDYIEFADKGLNSREASEMEYKFYVPETRNNRVVFNYGNTTNQVQMIGADDLHLSDYTGDGIVVAVLDSGFPNVNTMGAFQRIRDAGKLLNGYDFVNRTENVYAYTGNSHGTRVLSDMAGFVQDQFVGTAPDATYYVFRTEDAGSENPVEESYWVEAAERADSLGVDIINTSLGYKAYDNPNYSHTNADLNGVTTFITRGANIAFDKGMLLVTSAGNSGTSGLGAPADSPGVLSIGAVDASGNYASFSSQGSSIQPTQKPDIVAQGASSYVVDQNNNIVTNSGTSFSSPIMAGGIASLWQAAPELTNAELMQIVRTSASQYNTPDFLLGYGIPDLQDALNQVLNTPDFEVPLATIKLYPNPVGNELKLAYPFQAGELVTLSIYNILGKQVIHTNLGLQSRTVDTSNLSNGVYLARLVTSSGVKAFKLIKE